MKPGALENRVLVIACGNELRGDDGLGAAAACRLATRCGPQVQVCLCHQLTPDLIEPISEAGLVIFIDASCDGEQAGQIGRTALDQTMVLSPGPLPLTHHAEPAWLLACCQAVYGVRPKALVFSVTASTFDHGQALSGAVTRALPELVEQVIRSIRGFCSQKEDCHA